MLRVGVHTLPVGYGDNRVKSRFVEQEVSTFWGSRYRNKLPGGQQSEMVLRFSHKGSFPGKPSSGNRFLTGSASLLEHGTFSKKHQLEF